MVGLLTFVVAGLAAWERRAKESSPPDAKPPLGSEQAMAPIPRELPLPPADFTSRDEELAVLGRLLNSGGGYTGRASATAASLRPGVIGTISGMGDIGKSALAIQAAHEAAPAFPDGQLCVIPEGAGTVNPTKRIVWVSCAVPSVEAGRR